MRIRSCLLLILLLAAPASAQPEWAFGSPAQFEGDVGLNATWVLLVFSGPSQASLSMQDVTYTNVTTGWVQTYANAPPVHYGTTSYELPADEDERQMGDVDARVAFGRQASLFVAADHIRLQVQDAAGEVEAVGKWEPVDDSFQDVPAHVYRPVRSQAEEGVAASGRFGDARFSLKVEGLRELEWHGGRVACVQADCPDGGGVRRHQAGDGAAWGRVVLSHFSVLEGRGRLEASGSLLAAAGGSEVIDFDVSGRARLPVARAAAPCECADPGGRTVTVEGKLSLSGLRAEPSSGLRAAVSGDAEALRFDETPLDPSDVFPAAAKAIVGTAVAAGLAALLWKAKPVASVLVSRLMRPAALRNRNRRAIFETIRADPGIHLRDLVRATALANATVLHHLTVLKRSELVVEEGHAGRSCFFADGTADADLRRFQAVLRDQNLRRIHSLLVRRPGLSQKSILAEAATWGWNRSTVQNRLQRLEQNRLVAARRCGRFRVYTANHPGAAA